MVYSESEFRISNKWQWLSVTPKPCIGPMGKKSFSSGLLTVYPLGLPQRTSYVAKHTETRVPTANVSVCVLVCKRCVPASNSRYWIWSWTLHAAVYSISNIYESSILRKGKISSGPVYLWVFQNSNWWWYICAGSHCASLCCIVHMTGNYKVILNMDNLEFFKEGLKMLTTYFVNKVRF